MHTIRQFAQIIDRHTFIVVALALLSTYVCRRLDLTADLPASLIGIAFIFPLVFSINSAYRRREQALAYFSSLKGHATALYYAHRDWPPDGNDLQEEGLGLLSQLLDEVATHFTNSKLANRDSATADASYRRVHQLFSEFSHSHERMRQAGVTSGEVSRSNQYLRAIMIDFERMNNILRYRTPLALRAYSRVFLNLFPIIFGPYFANIAYPGFPIVGYVVAVFYGLVLVSLDNIQDNLENPFDGQGPDDLHLNIAAKYGKMLAGENIAEKWNKT